MEPAKWLVNNVPGYDQLPRADRKTIRDFALLWSLFEYRLLGTNGNRETIAAAMTKLRPHINATRLSKPIKYFAGRYVADGALNDLFGGLKLTNLDDRALVSDVLLGTEIAPARVATALMLIVYRLRNNLFHGPKWAYGIAGQRQNFHHANIWMMEIMEMHHANGRV